MKTKFSALSLMTMLVISGSAVQAQDNTQKVTKVNHDVKTYKIAKRLDDYTRPITFTPTKATPVNGAITENIVTSTQNILNKEAMFLKKGVVKPVGEKNFSAWQTTSDEGGAAHIQTAPNPLTYYAAGSASSLLTQVERAIAVLALNVEDVKVESKILFRWSDTMSDKWSGYTDTVISNILIKSDEPVEKIQAAKKLALQAWAVGEGLANKTTIDAKILVNTDDWAGLRPNAGEIGSPVSVDNGFKITDITDNIQLQTMKVEKNASVDMHQFPKTLKFPEIAIAESAHDASRPYLHKIRAKSLTQNYATWELYTDDSRGYAGINKAPTSRDYFTIGTSYCLMSQLTAAKMYFYQQGINIDNYRVEHQFNYQQDNFMTPSMNGHLDKVITRIVVTSKAPKDTLIKYAKQALSMCFAGEGIQNETQMQTALYLNGKIVQ